MAPSPTIRRLLKETSELSSTSKNPNPAFHAAPVSEADLHEWHFTLLGPPAPSPYAGGMYHGRISLPPSYPLKPPNFRFLTPSGRFEVNREICLSISGFHEETWMPAWGVRTALTALRSFMAESGTAGQVGGLEASREVRERLASESRGWRCVECGGRSNEEVMKEWWEACAEKGVKVGEDVGLEVLPEGLSLEAKVPSGGGGVVDRNNKAKEETKIEEVKIVPTPATVSDERSRELQRELESILQSHPAPPSPPSMDNTRSPSPATIHPHPHPHSQLYPHPQSQSQPQSQPQSQATRSTTTTTTTSQPPISSSRQTLDLPRQPRPIVNHPNTTHQRQEDTNTVTIDRAIYVVFVALLLMCIKKIFYPAARAPQWEDYAIVRE